MPQTLALLPVKTEPATRPCPIPDAVSILSALSFTAADLDVWGPPFPLTPEATSALSRAMETALVADTLIAHLP